MSSADKQKPAATPPAGKKGRMVFIGFAAAVIAIAVYFHNTTRAEAMYTFPKGSTFEKEWKRVDSLSDNGLYNDALTLTNAIYQKAKAEKNSAQIIKSLMHRFRFSGQVEESSEQLALIDLRNELKTSKYPLTPILHSMLAELYWSYYQQNRWQISQRTQTVNFKMDDIATWDAVTLVDQSIKEYNLSLENKDSLQHTELGIYDDVINRETHSRDFRPTLYDFLAHRALDFFASAEPDITRPADKFELTDPACFDNYRKFIRQKYDTKDTLSTKFYAVRILQDLLAFHADDKTPEPLADADLKRLKLMRHLLAYEGKDSLYERGLNQLSERVEAVPMGAEVQYELALLYNEKGNSYSPLQGDAHKWDKKKALELCDKAIAKYPGTDGAFNCQQLKTEINYPSLSFQGEAVEIPGKPGRVLLNYRNIKKLYLRVIPVSVSPRSRYGGDGYKDEDERIKSYLAVKPLAAWEVTIPDDGDFQSHSTELKIPEQLMGHYIVLASPDKDFKTTKNAIAYASLAYSDISYVQRRMDDGTYEYLLLSRSTGEPLKGVKTQLWFERYDQGDRQYKMVKGEELVSDADGTVRIPPTSDWRNYLLEFKYGKDYLLSDYTYQYRYGREERMRVRTVFFTDRLIYRPGQTIYFKGIMLQTDGEKNELLKNRSTTVTFYDANYQKISSLDLKSNEYGTFSGTFTAPQGLLTGQMRIDNGSGSLYFSVEEYKRPKFEVKINPVKGSYRIGDEITVEGVAKAYAGSSIDGAKVSYRVVRNASFPYWWWCWRGYYPNSPEMEITNGVVTSNDTGGFVVKFKALPDPTISEASKPTYSFTIYADVTDIGGETHSASGYVSVGSTAINLNIGVDEKVNKNESKPWSISSTNLSGEPEPCSGTVSIWKIAEPAVAYRTRRWSRPDKFVHTKEEWAKWFPNDPYDDENNRFKWAKGEKVHDGKFDTGKEKELKLALNNWKPGLYMLEALSKDKYGQEVKEVKYFTIFGEQERNIPGAQNLWFNMVTGKREPGEKAVFLVGSSQNVKVRYEIEHKNKIVARQWITLNKEQKRIEIPVEEKHRGNFSIHLVTVNANRAYEESATIIVPWSDKALDLSFESFRSKLLPGQTEEWKIKVKGPKGEKMAAEMVATLYDASLDAFAPNYWSFDVWNTYYASIGWSEERNFSNNSSSLYDRDWYENEQARIIREYDYLNWFGAEPSNYWGYGYRSFRGNVMRGGSYQWDFAASPAAENRREDGDDKDSEKLEKAKPVTSGTYALTVTDANGATTTKNTEVSEQQLGGNAGSGESDNRGPDKNIKARSNLVETAFFFPHLQTNENGEIIIKFTIPEALTRWKMLGFAHTKELQYGQITNELVTQKELMVMPNAPRFFRENDRMTFSAKVSNLSAGDMTGKAQLFLYDATTMQDITRRMLEQSHGAGDAIEDLNSGIVSFSAKKGLSAPLTWNITIPEGVGAILYKVIASAGNFSDGEEAALPVLTNRMLVTESMPLPIRGGQSKTFRFEKLISQGGGSSTLRNHKLTLEFTSNPAWYGVQALPYLMEYPYECAEQTFSRYYANSIASHIANSSPKIKAVFDSWKTQDPKALVSNLEKNQELKALLLEETPWVLESKDESERKRRVALLFDLNRMGDELGRAERKLVKMQYSNGGWPWFDGMPEDRYITQHIITGMGHLDKLGVKSVRSDNQVWDMVQKGSYYLDDRIREDYEWILKHDKANLDKDHLGSLQIQYLYARTYFLKDIPVDERNKKAYDYYLGQAKKYWLTKGRYMQGMIALALNRNNEKTTAAAIMKSIKNNAIVSEEMGMYWKENYSGFYWYEAPIESQALLIEAFDEVSNDQKAVDDLKVWLLKSKQTQDWKTTKATTEACYALLMRGTDWLATESGVEIVMGSMVIDPKKMDDVKVEAGTGYFKKTWSGKEIDPKMGEVKVTKKDAGVSWGAVYWQYFEQLDKITPHETPLKIKKQLFLQKNTASGPVLTAIENNGALKVGDKLKVRIELRVDRDMEYVHMKDMRASGFEPTNVFSQYKWQDGLGYYESTRDAATNFFFSYLPKGTYVFEYPMVVTHAGDFSNGITSIQCMYAPEFTSHSQGIRVKVGK